MPTVHATPTDLAAAPWNLNLGEEAAQRLLTRATTIIRGLTITAVYATGPDGTPSDNAVAEALRDATCAQAVWFDQTGDDGSGAASAYSTMSLGSARLSVGGAGSSTNTGVTQSRYAPEAIQILSNAGLTAGQVQSAW